MAAVKSKEEGLWDTARGGDLAVVTELAEDPAVDVNWLGENLASPFLMAYFNNCLEVVKYLLQHPRVDVNLPQRQGCPPIYLVCEFRNEEVVKLLLQDPRVNASQGLSDGRTPLWTAAHNGCLDNVQRLMVSGRDLSILAKVNGQTAADQAR